MGIWNRDFTLAELERMSKGTMIEHLGIEYTEIGPDFLAATMPVDHRTRQPAGLLHGGASVALAETLGSVAANLVTGMEDAPSSCVGLDINANHIRPMRSGLVRGVTRPLHLGKRTQIWEIRLTDEDDRLVCVSRLTMAVLTS